jgi:hypothetical protein
MRRIHRPAVLAPHNRGSDPYFGNVVLLLDASSYADGSTPSTLDVIGKTPTWRGNAQCKTDQFNFGSSSIYLDGTNDRVIFPDSADWAMGTGDATWEAWVRPEGSFSGASRMWLAQAATYGSFYSISGRRNSSDLHEVWASDGSTYYGGISGHTLASDAWSHVAITRQGGNLYSYVNGVRATCSTSMAGVTILDSSGAMCIGAWSDADNPFHWKGWIDQVRITKGVARYTASFDVPTAPFPHG